MARWLKRLGGRKSERGDMRIGAESVGSLLEAIRKLKQHPDHSEALGSFIGRSDRDSKDILSDMASIEARVGDLLSAFGESLEEISSLRSERTRLASLVEATTRARDELSTANLTLAQDNKSLKSVRADLELTLDRVRSENNLLQSNSASTAEELNEIRQRADLLQQELTIASEALETAQRERKDARSDLDQARDRVRTLQSALDAERSSHALQIERSSQEFSHLEHEAAETREAHDKLLNEKMHALHRIATLERDLERARSDYVETDLQLKSAVNELDAVRSQLQSDLAKLNARNEAIAARAALTERLLETARDRNVASGGVEQQLRRDLQALRGELAEKGSRASTLSDALARMQTENADMYRALKERERILASTIARLDEMRNGREKADREVAQLRTELAEVTKNHQAAKGQLTTRLSILEAENRELGTQRDTLAGQIEQLRAYGHLNLHSAKDILGDDEREPEQGGISSPRLAKGLNVISMTELAKGDVRQDMALRD